MFLGQCEQGAWLLYSIDGVNPGEMRAMDWSYSIGFVNKVPLALRAGLCLFLPWPHLRNFLEPLKTEPPASRNISIGCF